MDIARKMIKEGRDEEGEKQYHNENSILGAIGSFAPSLPTQQWNQ